jgi:thioredoxin 1
MGVLVVTEETFSAEVLKSDKPVVVEFGAVWCGPCQRQLPILEAFENNNRGLVKVCKVDIDENQNLARQMMIRAVPTIMVFKNGSTVKTVVGMQTGTQLESLLPENQIDPAC